MPARRNPLSPQPCSSCGETKKILYRGWCAACYSRWIKASRPESGPPEPRNKPQIRACVNCGEIKPIAGHDWCKACYSRWLTGGRPEDGPPPPKSRPARERACAYCGKIDRIHTHGWCGTCYSRWLDADRPSSGPPPPPERHAHPHRCPFCDRTVETGGCNRGWCKVCYTRWRKAGKPDGGPARAGANRKPRVRTCATCGYDKPIQGKEMCRQCYESWYRENRSGTCAICGLERKFHAGDLCIVCYHRQHRDYDAETLARWNRREQLDTLRVTWALAHPGRPGNPYECNVTDCHATANPGFGYLCVKHYSRIYRTGRQDRDPCVKCGGELDGRSERLCSGCNTAWRYCDQPSHQGDRLLPVSEFGNQRGAYCKECLARKYFPRKCHCERCGKEPVRNGGASLCQECSESWFYCASAVHDGDRLVPLKETTGRDKSGRRCKQCLTIRREKSPRKILACLACGNEKRITAHGWCAACNRRWLAAGKPDTGPPPPWANRKPQIATCLSCGEKKRIAARDWCGACYARWRDAGKPDSGPPRRRSEGNAA